MVRPAHERVAHGIGTRQGRVPTDPARDVLLQDRAPAVFTLGVLLDPVLTIALAAVIG